jgi:hypothetical protein
MARSPIPRVIGVAMLAVAAIGVAITIRDLAGADAASRFTAVPLVFATFDLAIDALQFLAGIRAVTYKPNATGLAVFYAVFKIVSALMQLLLVVTWLAPALQDVSSEGSDLAQDQLRATAVAVAWAVVVAVAMTRPSVKRTS